MGNMEDDGGREGSREGLPDVFWNEEQADRFSPNAFHVTYSREEVELQFGEGRRSSTSNELVLEQRAQILLSPVLAKRLALRLQKHVQDHERRFGPLDLRPPQRAETASLDVIGRNPAEVEPGDLPETARHLVQSVRDLGVVFGLERSFKFTKELLLPRRLLVGFRRNALPPDGSARLIDLCRSLDMPPALLASFQEKLPGATVVLFGFEQEYDGDTLRAYLEFPPFHDPSQGLRPPREPFTAHLGFKWDAREPSRNATTRYTCFPGLPVERMAERIHSLYSGREAGNQTAVIEGILELAARKGPKDAFLYFEAEEEDSPRTSFDLNLYAANLRMNELTGFLSDICTHYSIPYRDFHARYEPVQNLIFGHLTGGLDRKGRDFMTVYFGEKGTTL